MQSVSLNKKRGNPHGVIAKVLDCSLKESKFKLQSHYYIQFCIDTLAKGIETSYPPPSYELNSIPAFVLQGWFGHEITCN